MEDFRVEYRDNHCEYRVGNWCTKNLKTIKVTINTICSCHMVFSMYLIEHSRKHLFNSLRIRICVRIQQKHRYNTKKDIIIHLVFEYYH